MKTTNKGINIIKAWESCKLTAYKCPAGVWTIGWGHTQEVLPGDTCTQEQANEWLKNDISSFEIYVNNYFKNVNQNQFDALVSLCYNIGPGNLKKSPLFTTIRVNANDPQIKQYFMRHIYAKSKVLQGLVKRRTQESNLYFS